MLIKSHSACLSNVDLSLHVETQSVFYLYYIGHPQLLEQVSLSNAWHWIRLYYRYQIQFFKTKTSDWRGEHLLEATQGCEPMGLTSAASSGECRSAMEDSLSTSRTRVVPILPRSDVNQSGWCCGWRYADVLHRAP